MTVLMKIDLVGPSPARPRARVQRIGRLPRRGRRGLCDRRPRGDVAPRTVVWVGGAAIASVGLVVSIVFVRDTGGHVAAEQGDLATRAKDRAPHAFPLRRPYSHPVLRACSQAGLVNNLNDALAWGLAPLYLAANGAQCAQIGVVAAVYPAVWGARQLGTGWLSDYRGPQTADRAGHARSGWRAGAARRRWGGIRARSHRRDSFSASARRSLPDADCCGLRRRRAWRPSPAVGVYRFWRDAGFVAGALLAGLVADAAGAGPAIALVAAITALSGLAVLATPWRRVPTRRSCSDA